MRNMNRISLKQKATSLDHAIELTREYAEQKRLPAKRIAELMSTEYKTYQRWMLELTLPLNRVPQLEHLIGCQFISEYLCLCHGSKVVIDIPRGKKSSVLDVAQLQTLLASVVTQISKFWQREAEADETIALIDESVTSLVSQRENVKKNSTPELCFGDEDDE